MQLNPSSNKETPQGISAFSKILELDVLRSNQYVQLQGVSLRNKLMIHKYRNLAKFCLLLLYLNGVKSPSKGVTSILSKHYTDNYEIYRICSAIF